MKIKKNRGGGGRVRGWVRADLNKEFKFFVKVRKKIGVGSGWMWKKK